MGRLAKVKVILRRSKRLKKLKSAHLNYYTRKEREDQTFILRNLHKINKKRKIERKKSRHLEDDIRHLEDDIKIERKKSRHLEDDLNLKDSKNKLLCRCPSKKCENIKYWYVLQLESNKKYVGTTRDLMKRYNQHIYGGSSWTREYKPIGENPLFFGKFCSLNKLFEDEKTMEMMNDYEIKNVRGGKWVRVILTGEALADIQEALDHTFGNCLTCHINGHFTSNCPGEKPVHINKNLPEWRRNIK